MILNNLRQWHPLSFFFQKMILAETRYKSHNNKFLAIIEAFKTWKHYLKRSQHEVFVLTNYNNLCQFINIKSLSPRQVC